MDILLIIDISNTKTSLLGNRYPSRSRVTDISPQLKHLEGKLTLRQLLDFNAIRQQSFNHEVDYLL